MLDIPGYAIDDVIFTSSASMVCRGRRLGDATRVIFKVTRADPPRPADFARFNCECAILELLHGGSSGDGFARLRHGNRLVLITEDIGARSLARHLAARGTFAIGTFLAVAVQAVDRLSRIHELNIIHKDINPNNIIWNHDTGEVRIIDFNISSVLRREKATVQSPDVLEGTLAYIAPEQTGRMNRDIDYRADLYSLGATFYELLTGHVPFAIDELAELVHAHLAIAPTPPHEVEATIPKTLSAIVMKLLNKEPEDRYQSTRRLRADLQACRERLDSQGDIEPFAIAVGDISERFRIPERLYGREREIATLTNAFDQVCAGSFAVTLVTGYSGIGKSALVHELYKPLTRRRGHFIAGKYEQYRRNIPYAGLVMAFRNLVRALLTEPEDRLARWRDGLAQAFGPNGAILTEVIPEVELIVGVQPPVQPQAPSEAQNRFNRVFVEFIRVFCQPEHPLVLFLDDLQWVDSASTRLLEMLISGAELPYLHVVGAYRDNEMSGEHPLMIALARQRQARPGVIHTIELAPLQLVDVCRLLGDTLRSRPASVRPLAELIDEKTSGNPFFVGQFLTTLFHNNVLRFDRERARWTWNLDRVEALGLTDNVVDLMVRRLNLMPVETARILRVAACVGSHFDLELLALIRGESAIAIHQQLMPALAERFIVPLTVPKPVGEGIDTLLMAFHYRFMHDRIQQAAHSLLGEYEMRATHLTIGRLLLTHLSADERADRVFEIADHLNVSRALITEPEARLELARLNLEAGRKAKDAAAHIPARWYLDTGIECLPGDSWQSNYELTGALYTASGEVEYLNGNAGKSTERFDELLTRVHSPLEKADIYCLLLVLHILSANHDEALALGRNALRYVGVELPDDDFEVALEREIQRVRDNLGDRDIGSLLDLPEARRPDKRMALRLLSKMGPLTFFADQALFPIVTIRSVNLSLEYGQMAESAVGYCNYGLFLSTALGRERDGYEFGRLAQRLSHRFADVAQLCVSSMMVGGVLNHWVHHISAGDTHLDEAYRAGLDSGEYPWVGFLLCWKMYLDFHRGTPLEQLRTESERGLVFCRKVNHQTATMGILGGCMAVANLVGDTPDAGTFCVADMDEAKLRATCLEHGLLAALCYFDTLRAQILYLHGQYRDALRALERCAEALVWIPGTFQVAAHNFYHSLAMAAVYRDADAEQQRVLAGELARNQDTMRRWMDNCPANFENLYYLVEAERARLRGARYESIELYERAMRSAMEHGFIQNYALINERAGEFWLELDNLTYARAHLNNALQGYQAWGASAKVASLSKAHALLLEWRAETASPSTSKRRQAEGSSEAPTSSAALPVSQAVDIATIIKAWQVIAGETVLGALLERLLEIVIQNVGAERGYVIMADGDGQFQIEAGVSVRGGDTRVAYPVRLASETGSAEELLVPPTIVHYVSRTRSPVVLADARSEGMFTTDPYAVARQPRSVLCAPIISQGQLIGVVYLENNLAANAFTSTRVETTQLLAAQAAIAIENARLLASLRQSKEELERKVEERTRDLRTAKDDAERTSRAKSEFLSRINHELRTPMNGVIGMLELMLRHEHLDEQREYLETARISAEQLMHIINDTLDLSRIEANKLILRRARFSLDECVGALVGMMSLRMRQKGLVFEHSIEPSANRSLLGDRNRLMQILINLLGNAVKFTSAGGTISLTITEESLTAEHIVLRFGVRDTGIGIPYAEQATIFDAYVQSEVEADTGLEYRGSGLGLSIAARLVALMDGTIQVESQLGEGSYFHFTARFGLADGLEVDDSVARGADGAPPAQGDVASEMVDGDRSKLPPLTVLVVEDNRINRLVATRFLDLDGHESVTAQNGVEAVDLVGAQEFDAILMDVQMPQMDGYEATWTIRHAELKTGKHVPIFAMTAYSMAEEIDQCLAAGMDGYLSKPVRRDELQALLRPIQRRKACDE